MLSYLFELETSPHPALSVTIVPRLVHAGKASSTARRTDKIQKLNQELLVYTAQRYKTFPYGMMAEDMHASKLQSAESKKIRTFKGVLGQSFR